MNKLLHNYKNGNATVLLYDDGTRIITSDDDELKLNLPLQCDIKISNQCKFGCPMCYEGSVPNGKHAPLENFKFLDSWLPGCEAALGGGMVTSHPYLKELLNMLKQRGIIANITVHQNELIENYDMIKELQDNKMIYGIGVSLHEPSESLANYINTLDNVVIHVINGLFTEYQYHWIKENINKPKVLILGYKKLKRGIDLYNDYQEVIQKNMEELEQNIDKCFKDYNVVSFDNLALKQLHMKDKIDPKEWELYYQGDETTMSMYIDAVEGMYASSSLSMNRRPITDDMHKMFIDVQQIYKKERVDN